MVLDGNQEKIPLDPIWAEPIRLPETISSPISKWVPRGKSAGRTELFFYPNGRIDQATMYLTDADSHILGVLVEPVTAMIRITDQRIDPPQPLRIPERLKPLLQPVTPGLLSRMPAGVPK